MVAQKSGIFHGDGDGLVDALIAACERKPAVSSDYTGFGRDLVPYFGFSEPDTPATTSPAEPRKGKHPKSPAISPQRSNARAGKQQRKSAPSDSGKTPEVDKSDRSIGKQFKAQPNVEPSRNLIKAQNDSKFSSPVPIPRASTTGKVAPSIFGTSPTNACPGIFSSPKPEHLPMPTGLLQRFTAVVPPAAA